MTRVLEELHEEKKEEKSEEKDECVAGGDNYEAKMPITANTMKSWRI